MAAPLEDFDPDRPASEIHKILFGGNMALRRTMFESYSVFRPDLRPSSNRETLRPNEETEFVGRLLAAGEHPYYDPSAIHFIPCQ